MTVIDVTSYRRRVSHVERSYLNALVKGSACTIQLVVECAGDLDLTALSAAVDRATDANPGMRVTRKGTWWKEGGEPPGVRIIDPAVPLRDNGFAHPWCYEGFDIVRGPVADVIVQPGRAGEPHLLIFRTSHAVSDGRGLEHWVHDIFRAMRGEEPHGSFSALTDAHFAARAAGLTVRDGGFQPCSVGSFASPFAPAGDLADAGRPVWTQRTITVGGQAGVAARIAVAVARRAPRPGTDGDARVVIPVDMRRHDKSVRSTANLSAPIFLDVDATDDWSAVHGDLLVALMSAKEAAPLVNGYRGSNGFAQTLSDAAAGPEVRDGIEWHPCSAVISDHGTAHLPNFSGGGLTARRLFTLPMLVPYSAMFVSAFTSRDQLTVTICHRDGPGARDTAESLLDEIQELLS
ncbi:hypothetical protein [Flexivirga meconopsidis]|uniref:hypothetical protein n=1 Tax=Flexivirga meconopsidis TaxID=2977121 RepID=UPI00223F1CE9|nr:hypothetical protein [Flexivirga meconopsidis]